MVIDKPQTMSQIVWQTATFKDLFKVIHRSIRGGVKIKNYISAP